MELTVEGNIYINGGFHDCCIGITNGKISAIKKILKGEKNLKFKHMLILPTGIDIHVHFREPGFTNKENFSTGSLSAAFGGISCIFDMPNTIPQTTNLNTLFEKHSVAKNKSYIDFGIYAGISNENIKQITQLSKHCSGFKAYMGETTSSLKINLINLKIALKTISEFNKPVLFHAEDYTCLNRHKIKEKNLFDHMNSRPSICEKKAIENVIKVSKQSNQKIHFCHISSYDGLDLLKKRPKNISCGVTPHHLLFNVEKIIENQTYFKVNPPIRRSYDREVLFKGIQSGLIDIIESDHAPHTLEEKNLDFDQAPSGVPGVETMYPLLLYLVKKEKLSFHRLINLICEKPADLMNISKGKLEIGNDADFIVLDIKKTSLIKSENLHSQIEWSPFENWKAIFPKHVFIRGEKIIENDELLVNKGFGRFVGE